MPPRRLLAALATCALAHCADDPGEIHVETVSMQDALDRSHPAEEAISVELTRHEPPNSPAGAVSIESTEGRMAWLYDWVDEAGNRHFGHWVAIPLAEPRWNRDEAHAPVPLSPPPPEVPQAPATP